MLTNITLTRWRLITKKWMENICKREEDPRRIQEDPRGSMRIREDMINDGFDLFFETIRFGKEFRQDVPEYLQTYFLPKLTGEELELVEKRDTSYFQTLQSSDPDVNKAQMILSESNSKYVYAWSERLTFIIENPSKNSLKSSRKKMKKKLKNNCLSK